MGYATNTNKLSTTSNIPPINPHRHATIALTKKINPGKMEWYRTPTGLTLSDMPEAMPKNVQKPAQDNARTTAMPRIHLEQRSPVLSVFAIRDLLFIHTKRQKNECL